MTHKPLQKFTVTVFPAPMVYTIEAISKEDAQQLIVDREWSSDWESIHKIVVTKG